MIIEDIRLSWGDEAGDTEEEDDKGDKAKEPKSRGPRGPREPREPKDATELGSIIFSAQNGKKSEVLVTSHFIFIIESISN
jgi:hypothetical protein